MIKNIQHLKKFGIFRNHKNGKTKDFGKFNLFYGWNGSGKSTLSDLFRCIEKKDISDKFPLAEFTITIDDDADTVITQTNVAENHLNVFYLQP